MQPWNAGRLGEILLIFDRPEAKASAEAAEVGGKCSVGWFPCFDVVYNELKHQLVTLSNSTRIASLIEIWDRLIMVWV